ncbi:hypothetical protein GPALN_005887 [Globodera pallida]|nr:hypothetical protein GPALN_005887 [Globodera pallida]
MSINAMHFFLDRLNEEKADGGGYRKDAFEQFKNDPRAMDLADGGGYRKDAFEQFKNDPLAMDLNKGKSTNLSKESNSDNWSLSSITASHYGAMPSQQVPPMDDTFVPSHAGTDSTDWFGENLQNNDGDLASVVRPKNTSSSASEGFDAPPFLLNQLQSTGWPGASNFFSPTPNTSNFTSGNPGSSAMPFQQVPMPGTSLAFPNDPFNQSAQLNSSTNFVPSQTETHSLDWSGGNSQNNEGTLESMFNTRKPRSEKTGKRSI